MYIGILTPKRGRVVADLQNSCPFLRIPAPSHLLVGRKWAGPGQDLSDELAAPPLHALPIPRPTSSTQIAASRPLSPPQPCSGAAGGGMGSPEGPPPSFPSALSRHLDETGGKSQLKGSPVFQRGPFLKHVCPRVGLGVAFPLSTYPASPYSALRGLRLNHTLSSLPPWPGSFTQNHQPLRPSSA